jgi:hypothetical protein
LSRPDGDAPAAAATTDRAGELVLYIGLGQSLLALVPRSRPLGEQPGLVDAARAWVFSASGDPRVADNPLVDLPGDTEFGCHPHRRHGRSGPLTAASASILAVLGPRDRLLTVNLARRNAALDAFGDGGGSFRNVEVCLHRAATLAAANGLRFRRMVVSFVQGQADTRTPHRRYAEQLTGMVQSLEAAVRRATEGRGDLLFCLSQTTASYRAGRRGAALAQLEVAEARPGQIVLAGPEYMLERSDGTHLTPASAVHLGVLHGRAIARVLSGKAWAPLRAVDALVRGNEILGSFAGGIGDLVADAGAGGGEAPRAIGMRELPALGFLWDGPRGSATSIATVRIAGPRLVAIGLSAVPPARTRASLLLGFPLGIGKPEGFVRGDPATARGGGSLLKTAGDGQACLGQPVRDWALQQRIALRWEETG